MNIHEHTKRLVAELKQLRFAPPVTHIYNPLEYAEKAHSLYLSRFGEKKGRILLMGMNPGPWGMAQTGIPFGEIESVRSWIGIETPIGKPQNLSNLKFYL